MIYLEISTERIAPLQGETMKLSNHRNLFAAALLFLPAALPKTHTPAPKAAPAAEGKLDVRLLCQLFDR